MSRSYQRPENALKRANEFLDVGKSSRALEVLYEVIKRGKMRTSYSEKLLEPIMFKYLELCVDLKKSHLAKEGLYQYRNIFQSVNVSSLEKVVRFYLQLAEERTENARKESQEAVVDIDDLDNLATPEEILLSAVSGEDAQDRSDRAILTPWVKFLWESYRQCLELLRINSRVEKLYHDIAKHAFKFCEKYNRKTEFRKLCENLRTHLTQIQKQQGSATAVSLNNPETQQMNLETRLEQLNYAIKMELWQEAYKAIEDISDLMSKSKKMPKPHVMASYYQKLAMVFWKAGNLLFHGAALFKLFQLLRDQKKNITSEEISKRASVVLMATLAIPLPSAHPEFDRFIETEKSALEKIDRLANLLNLPKPPTRASLIKDLVRYNVIGCVCSELQSLYHLMEVEFDPLNLCLRMQGYLNWITEHAEAGLQQYITSLKEMTIMRLVKQVSQVYQTITFERLLVLSIFVTPFHLERILVDLVRHNDLQIRIDHRSKCIHFGVDLSESQREDLPEGPTLQALPSETIRNQLVHMSASLQRCVALITPDNKKKEVEPLRLQSIQLYEQNRMKEHQRLLMRQQIIEQRKEMLETQNLEREENQRRAQEELLRKQKEEEEERLKREASKRERERQEEQMKQIHTKQIQDKLLQISKTSYGQKMIEKIDKEELLNLDADEILQRQVEELEKERKELQQRLKAQEKKVDHFERAKRLTEIPKLKTFLEAQKEKDREFWQTQEEERVKKMVEEHRVALENSKRLTRMMIDKDTFLNKLKSTRRSEIEKKLEDFNARLEVERKKRLAERKAQRREERKKAYEKAKKEEEEMKRYKEIKKQREEEERIEREKMKQEEEELARRKADLERKEEKKRETAPEEKPGAWRPGKGSSRDKEKQKLDSWRRTEDSDRDRDKVFGSRDIRRDEPRDDRLRDGDRIRDREPPRDDWRSSPRDLDRGPSRDFGRGPPPRDRDSDRGGPPPRERDFNRGPGRDREFDRGHLVRDRDLDRGLPTRDRDFDRGPPPRDREFDRGPPPRDREFDRGPPPRDREFDRGPPPRDRELERGLPARDREYEKGPPSRDREFDRGPPPRDREFDRGPPPGDREFERGPPSRDKDKEFERGPPPRDRDIERGPSNKEREFEKIPPSKDRDIDRGPARRDKDTDKALPPRDREIDKGPSIRDREIDKGPSLRDRDIDRGPARDSEKGPIPKEADRVPPRDADRGPAHKENVEKDLPKRSSPAVDGNVNGESGRLPTRGQDLRDFREGDVRDRDSDRGPPRDFGRGPRETDRGPRDFDGRSFRDDRGPSDRDRDFDRRDGPRRGGFRDFDRDRDRDFTRRDDRRPPPSRADEETSWRRGAAPLAESGPRRDDRGFWRGGGERGNSGDSWRRGEPLPPKGRDEGNCYDGPRKDRARNEPDDEGWTTV